MCGSMADIQSPTAEIRRGKKEWKKKNKKPQLQNIMSASAMQGGHNKYRNGVLKSSSYAAKKHVHNDYTLIFTLCHLPMNSSITRWLYCVECPQYSTRLEALGYLCDCLSGHVQRCQVVRVIWHQAHCCRRRMVQMLFDRWWQHVLPWGHIGATWRIRLNLCILQSTRVHNLNGKSIG